MAAGKALCGCLSKITLPQMERNKSLLNMQGLDAARREGAISAVGTMGIRSSHKPQSYTPGNDLSQRSLATEAVPKAQMRATGA